MILEHLPPHLLNAILSSNNAASLLLSLYACGSRLLQHKLLHGVSSISLCDRKTLGLPTLPKIVPSFRSLRSLTINRNGNVILDHSYISQALLTLRDSLEELTLNFSEAGQLFSSLLSDYSSTSASATPFFNGSQEVIANPKAMPAFPRLQSLDLVEIDAGLDLSFHVPSLTRLRLAFVGKSQPEEFRTFLSHLPRTLLDLLLRSTVAGSSNMFDQAILFLEYMPPNLEHLRLGLRHSSGFTLNDETIIKKLPKHLQTLEIPRSAWTLSKRAAAALPSTLTTLTGCAIVKEQLEEILKCLPTTLVTMRLKSLKLPSLLNIQLLPSKLRDCCLELGKSDELGPDSESIAFPPDMRTLQVLIYPCVSNKIWSLLPRHLTHLNLQMSSKSLTRAAIAALPRTLVLLKCEVEAIWDEERIPFEWPKLRSLGIHNAIIATFEDPSAHRPKVKSCLLYHGLPNSLTNLAFTTAQFPYSALPFLPDRLRHLHLCPLVLDQDWVPSSAKLALRARHLQKEGLESGHLDAFEKAEYLASTSPTEVTAFDMLPRSLVELSIRTDRELQPNYKACARFPKFLEVLSLVGSCTLEADIFTYIPMDHLRFLYILTQGIDLEAMRRLPRQLEGGWLTSIEPIDNTEEMARAVPHSNRYKLSLDLKAWTVLEDQRYEAINRGDIETLKALMLP